MKKLNVFSTFDGIGGGRIALEKVGIPVEKYYSSELDPYAIGIMQYNYPDTIQMGDINNWKEWDIDWASIDLFIGGSPCQGFSLNGKMLNFEDPRSKLFFIYVEILNHIKSLNPNVKFLLENVKMKKEWEDIISKYLGVEPLLINSALVSAQSRPRLYWANWEFEIPADMGILLNDILEDGYGISVTNKGNNVGRLLEKSHCLMARDYKGFGNQCMTGVIVKSTSDNDTRSFCVKDKIVYDRKNIQTLDQLNVEDGKYTLRRVTPLEYERLQTVPDFYTQFGVINGKTVKISNTQRFKALGNGWTTNVISHIFSKLKEKAEN